MKKVLGIAVGVAAALAAVALLIFVLYAGKETENGEKSLYEHGLDLVALLDEMAGNDAYTEMFSVNEEINAVLDEIAKGDYTEPTAVYQAMISADGTMEMMESLGMENTGDMSDALKKSLEQKLFATFVSQLNGMTGVTNLAASSICTAGKSFVNGETEQDALYFYVYPDTQPVAVSFIIGEDHAVNASASFLMAEELKGVSGEDFEAYFEEFGVELQSVK